MTTYKTQLTATTPYVNYQFRVKANNQQGAGEWSMTLGDLGPSPDVQFNYNKAEGGSVSEFTDSNGIRMRVHQFTAAGNHTLEVKATPRPFRIAAVAAGYNSDRNAPGARGRTTWSHDITLQPKDYTVKVGNPNGGQSGVVDVLVISGSAGGAGDQIPDIFRSGNWQSGGAGGPCCGIPTGQGYAVGGGYSDNSLRSPGTHPGAGGGAGVAVDPVWQPGYRGIVAVAYEIPA